MSEDDKREFFSVDELERKIKAHPKEISLTEDLADALVDRYLYGDDDQDPGNNADTQRLRRVLSELPPEKASYPRAYMSYLDSKDKDAAKYLVKFAKGSDKVKPAEPFSPDQLYWDLISPFWNASKEFWSELAYALGELWPQSPAALVLAGYVNDDNNKPEDALDCYDLALRKDRDYWLAAWELGRVNQLRKNWQVAVGCYLRALESQLAQKIPDIHFNAAICLGNIQRHTEEEKHYRRCLDIDPNYSYARNNLGWSLYRQERFKEALDIFEDCIKRKVDGAYPLRNRARALARLGRLTDAIAAWKQTGRGSKLTKQAQEQITKLQTRINRGEARGGRALNVTEYDEEGDDASYQGGESKRRG